MMQQTKSAGFLPVLIVMLALAMPWTAFVQGQAILPPPADTPGGLLFHASFDVDRQADHATGSSLPDIGRYPYQDYTAQGGQFVPGVFGQALAGGVRLGHYNALGNVNPQSGTIAFFLRQKNRPYGFEPLVVSTVDSYYWLRYLRMEINRNGAMVISAANEIYRPQALGAPPPTLRADTWHHLAMVWDQAHGMRLYVDGKLLAERWDTGWTWTSRGVDPDALWLHPGQDVQYDELYIFDRPLTEEQVLALATENKLPAAMDLPAITFDDAWRANRLRELSWESPDAGMIPATLGQAGLGVNAISQVTPLQARAVMGECNFVINGKPGDGWPATYGYNFNQGNGLHVQVQEPFDYVTIEGYFRGQVYPRKTLVPTDHDAPMATINSMAYLNRWRLAQPHDTGWLSFFKGQWEEADEQHRDRESATTSRITELGFFRLGRHQLHESQATRHYLGQASTTSGQEMLGADFIGRYGKGDRAAFTLDRQPPAQPGGQALAGLRYHHLFIPAQDHDWALAGLRLGLLLQGRLAGNALRIEMHDPLLPARRLLAVDYALATPENADDHQSPAWLDLTLDVTDRVIPAGRPVWITLAVKEDVNLLWRDAQDRSSFIETYSGSVESAAASQVAADLPLILSRFGDLSSPRPWGSLTGPEKVLPRFYRLAGEMFLPLAQLHRLSPQHPTIKALWLWTHKDTVNQEPVFPTPVAGHPDAPRWALLQRELFHANRSVFEWWIDNRQAPTGEFGDDWNDDTDFVQDYPKYILAMDGGDKLLNSLRLVADGVYRFKRLTDGINTNPTDPLHAYEEGVNVQSTLALVDDGNPTQAARLMESARTVEERLTALDVHGRRRFRSNHYGATDIRDQSPNNVESFQNNLFAHPAMMLAYTSRNPRATRFVLDYADGWLAYFNDALAAGEKRIPAATTLEGVVTRWDTRVRGFGIASLFAAANALEPTPTRQAAARHWTMAHGGQSFRTGDAMAGLAMIDYQPLQTELKAWADRADLTRPYVDRFGHVARQHYMGYEVTGDEAYVYRALEASLRNIRNLRDGYTIGEPQNDRIWPPDLTAAMMLFGEVPDERNQTWPRHYLSYRGFTDFTAWVQEKSDTRLQVLIYSFAPKAESGWLRFWRTPLGTYHVKLSLADEQGRPTTTLREGDHTLHRFAGVPVRFPSGQLMVLEVELRERSAEDFWQRADLGIGREDVQRLADGTLRVRVHNLGNSAADHVVVQVRDDGDAVLSEQVIQVIPAPVDMHPRSVSLDFTGLRGGAPLRVVVNPDRRIAELNEFNNQVKVE